MKKHRKPSGLSRTDLDEILPEYDFSDARPNKYAAQYNSAAAQPAPRAKEAPSHMAGNGGVVRKRASVSNKK